MMNNNATNAVTTVGTGRTDPRDSILVLRGTGVHHDNTVTVNVSNIGATMVPNGSAPRRCIHRVAVTGSNVIGRGTICRAKHLNFRIVRRLRD